MKMIKLKPYPGNIYINIKTLKYSENNIYICEKNKKDWVEIKKSQLKQYIDKYQTTNDNNSINDIENTETVK